MVAGEANWMASTKPRRKVPRNKVWITLEERAAVESHAVQAVLRQIMDGQSQRGKAIPPRIVHVARTRLALL